MAERELPSMIVTDDPRGAQLPTMHVWRQIAAISIAWVAMLVSLIAVPGLRLFTVLALVGVLVVVAVSWFRASRAESKRAWAASRRAPLIR